MTFLLEQGLAIELGSVTLEKASLLLLIGAKASALDVSERAQALERVAGRNTDRRGSRGGKSREPRQRFRAESLYVVDVHILMFSSRHPFRGQSVQTLHGCNGVPHCDQHRWEQLLRACHAHSITKRHASRCGDTSSNCQVSVRSREIPYLRTSGSHVQGQVSGYISLMTESYSS